MWKTRRTIFRIRTLSTRLTNHSDRRRAKLSATTLILFETLSVARRNKAQWEFPERKKKSNTFLKRQLCAWKIRWKRWHVYYITREIPHVHSLAYLVWTREHPSAEQSLNDIKHSPNDRTITHWPNSKHCDNFAKFGHPPVLMIQFGKVSLVVFSAVGSRRPTIFNVSTLSFPTFPQPSSLGKLSACPESDWGVRVTITLGVSHLRRTCAN